MYTPQHIRLTNSEAQRERRYTRETEYVANKLVFRHEVLGAAVGEKEGEAEGGKDEDDRGASLKIGSLAQESSLMGMPCWPIDLARSRGAG